MTSLEDESGSGESDDSLAEEEVQSDTTEESGAESGDAEDHDVTRRNSEEGDMESLFEKVRVSLYSNFILS